MSFIFSNSLVAPHTYIRHRNLNMAWKDPFITLLLHTPTSLAIKLQYATHKPATMATPCALRYATPRLPATHKFQISTWAEFLGTWSDWFYYSSLYIRAALFVNPQYNRYYHYFFFFSSLYSTITPTGQGPDLFTIWTEF